MTLAALPPELIEAELAKLDPMVARALRVELGLIDRAEQLGERDDAIRQAGALWRHLRVSGAAKQMATALERYLGAAWQRERTMLELPVGTTPRRVALHRIARLNGGRSLSWSQIRRVLLNTEESWSSRDEMAKTFE